MEEKKKSWLFVVVLLAAALLSFWGMERVWTAAELLPETKSPSVSATGVAVKTSGGEAMRAEKEKSTEDVLPALEEETAVRYAVGKHKRNKPLSDPFRVEAAALPAISKESGRPAVAPVSSVPRLCGIVIAGEDRRAIVEDGNMTRTLREGEGTAGWTVTEIRETEVHVTGSFGTQILTI